MAEVDSRRSGEPGVPARWGSPEFYHQTMTPPRAPAPRPGGPRRLRNVLIGVATFLAAGGITAAVMLIMHPLRHAPVPPGPGPTASSSVSVPVSSPVSSPVAQPAEEQAARGLATLLTQSVADRSSIVAAVTDVGQCGPNLRQDPQIFQAAVTSRQDLLSRLASLPRRSALPASMLAALTSAWQNSAQADQYYAQWARDEITKGCTANNTSDPNAQAAAGPDAQATTGKQAFVSAWNPIAAHYGLSAYQWNQL